MLDEDKNRKLNTIREEIDSLSYKSRRCVYSKKSSSNVDYLVDRAFAKQNGKQIIRNKIKKKLPWKQTLAILVTLIVVLAAIPYVLPPLYGDFGTDVSIVLDPDEVHVNESVLINVSIPSFYNITNVSADMAGVETINLSLFDNSTSLHLWQAVWLVHDLLPDEYIMTITASDGLNMTYSAGTRLSVVSDDIHSDNQSSEPDDNDTLPPGYNETIPPDVDDDHDEDNNSIIPAGLDISMLIENHSYYINETVLITGEVTYNYTFINTAINLSFIGPSFNKTAVINATNGTFSYKIKFFNIGIYKVQGQISYNNETKDVERMFYIDKPTEDISIQTKIDQSINKGKPVLLFFYTNGCNPCQEEEKVLIELINIYAEEIDFIYVHETGNQSIIEDFDVKNYPTMFLIIDKVHEGYLYKYLEGIVNKTELMSYIDQALDKNESNNFAGWWRGEIVSQSPLELPSEIDSIISNNEPIQIIIKCKDGENLTEKVTYLKSIGFVPTAEIESLGFIAGVIDKVVYDKIKFDSGLDDVYTDDGFTVLLNESLPLVRYNEAAQSFNVTGSGKKICIIDTGVDSSIVNYSYGYDFVHDDNIPDDEHGHGTRVAAVIASIAPDSELVVAKVIDGSGVGYESDVLEALEWCIEQSPDVISFSIGTEDSCDGFCNTNFVANMSNDAFDSGIFVVAASGNDGSKSLKSPACGSNVFSVGATDDYDNIASFSNVNPTLDLFAPGVDITTFAGTGSGTSYSAPHVAAASLLVLELVDLNPIDLKYRLRSTGVPVGYVYNESLSLDIARLDVYNVLANNKTMEPYDYSWWWQGILGDGEVYEPLDVVSLLPDAEGDTQTWTIFPADRGGLHWNKVDDPVGSPDGDSTYVYSTTVQNEEFNHTTDEKLEGATISEVKVVARMKYVGVAVTVNIGLNVGGTRFPGGSNNALTASYAYYEQKWNQNPADSQDWEKSDIDSLQTSLRYMIGMFPGDAARCTQVYLNVTYTPVTNNAPTQSNPGPTNGSTGQDLTPPLNVTCYDTDDDTMNATWWSNSSGSWVQFASNTSIASSYTNIIQTNSNFSNYSTTYYWSVNLSDGEGGWDNETYHFTTENITTSVDTIQPYNLSSSTKTLTATCSSSLDNVTLWYRYSSDNLTWGGEDPDNEIGVLYAEQNTEQSQQGATEKTLAAIDSADFVVGDDYIIIASCHVSASTSSTRAETYLKHGSSIFTVTQEEQEPPFDSTTAWIYSTVIKWTAISGESIELTGQEADDTAGYAYWDEISLMVIPLKNLTEGIDYWYDSETTADNNMDDTWANNEGASITFTPDGTSNYLAMASSRIEADTTENDLMAMRIAEGGSGLGQVERDCEDSNDESVLTYIRILEAPSASSTEYTVQFQGDSVHDKLSSQLFILNLSAFKNSSYNQTSATNEISSSWEELGNASMNLTYAGNVIVIWADLYEYTQDKTTLPPNEAWIGAIRYRANYGNSSSSSISKLTVTNRLCSWNRYDYTEGADRGCGIMFDRINIEDTSEHWYTLDGDGESVFVVHSDYGTRIIAFSESTINEGWKIWNNANNPDTASPWSWDFNFPDGSGYYEFYSMGNKTGSPNETAPRSANAICYLGDNTKPTVDFELPTPANNTELANTWADVNVSVSDTGGNVSSFIDWDGSLRGYWSMEYLNSTGVFDNSTYDNFATYNGDDFDENNQTSAIYGDGLEFDGDDDYLLVSDHSSLDITDEITIEAWAKDPPLIPSKDKDTKDSFEEIESIKSQLDKNKEIINYNISDITLYKTKKDTFYLYNLLETFDLLKKFYFNYLGIENIESDNNYGNNSKLSLDKSIKQFDEYLIECCNSKTEKDKTRAILKFKEGITPQKFTKITSDLENSGFIKTMEIFSERIVAGYINNTILEKINIIDDIEEVYTDREFEILLTESMPLIGVEKTSLEYNLTGKGKKICILDTGVDSTVVNYSSGYDFVYNDNISDDNYGHGTIVASIIDRIAPDAELIVAKVIGDDGTGYESDVLEGLQWCINQDPDVISFSIGAGSYDGFCDNNLIAQLCDQAFTRGIFIVAAAGSDGNRNLRAPACGSNVFSVGATDDQDNIASFSSVNPTIDMFAPGVNIVTKAGSGSGTSLSAPHVAASSLLLLEKEDLDVQDLKYRLKTTGKPILYQYNDTLDIYIPRLDIYNSLINNKTMEPYDYSWYNYVESGDKNEEYIVLTTDIFYSDNNDTCLYEASPDANFGNDSFMYVDSRSTQNNRMMVQFDLLSEVPYGCDIIDAKLEIYYYGKSIFSPVGRTYRCHRIFGSWEEWYPTWNNWVGKFWGSGYSTDTVPGSYGYMEWDVTDHVQGIVDQNSSYYNNGWLIKDSDETTAVNRWAKFYSSEHGSNKPKLTVQWSCNSPTVTNNGGATSVEETTATLRGEVTETGGCDPTAIIYYGDNEGSTNPLSWDENVNAGAESGSFSEGVTGLTSADLYYYRCYASNSGGGDWADSAEKFLTKPNAPSTLTASSQTKNCITYTWNATSKGTGATLNTKVMANISGFPSDHEDGTEWYNSTSESDTQCILLMGQIYYVRAWSWATEGGYNKWSDGYDSEIMYTKPGDPTSLTADNPTISTINLSWTIEGSNGGDRVVIRNSTSGYPSDPTGGYETYNSTDMSGPHTDTGLEPGTTYYYSLWIYDSESGYFSDVKETAYNTTNLALPTVVTLSAIGVEETNATIRAEITSTGGKEPYRWIVWNTSGSPFTDPSKNESFVPDGIGIYSKDITGLSNGTQYHFRGLANNSVGWSNGTNITFWTKPQPPSDFGAIAINNTRINLTWTIGNGAVNTTIIQKAGSSPTSRSDYDKIVYNGTGTSCNDTLLDGFTTYYYRAWSTTNPDSDPPDPTASATTWSPKTILAKGDAYELFINGTTLYGYLNGTLIVNTSIDEEWHHVAFTYNGSVACLYVDGNLNDTNSSYNEPIKTNNNNLVLGQDFQGTLDEVRLWSRELSWEEVNASYDASSYYSHNFTGLSCNNYSYYAHAIDELGNENVTETRYYNCTNNCPVSPSNGAPTFNNPDDGDNCYAQIGKWYNVTVKYTDNNGYSDFDYVELRLLNQSDTTRAIFRYTESTNTFSQQDSLKKFEFNTSSSFAEELDNNITIYWLFKPHWNAENETDYDIQCYCIDGTGLSDNDTTADQFDVITNLLVSSIECNDTTEDSGVDRISLNIQTQVNLSIRYANDPGSSTPSSSYPPDDEFTSVSLYNSSDYNWGTNNSISNGNGTICFTPDEIGIDNYTLYINMKDGDYSDGEKINPYETIIVDRVNVTSIAVSEHIYYDGSRYWDKNTPINLTYTAKLDYDGTNFTTVNGELNAGYLGDSTAWGGTTSLNISVNDSSSGNIVIRDDATAGSVYDGGDYGITALTVTASKPDIGWDWEAPSISVTGENESSEYLYAGYGTGSQGVYGSGMGGTLKSYNVSGTASDNSGSGMTSVIDDTSFGDNPSNDGITTNWWFIYQIDQNDNGDVIVNYTAEDNVGNTNTVNYTFYEDNDDPTLSDAMFDYSESGDTDEVYGNTSSNIFYFSNSFDSYANIYINATGSDTGEAGVRGVDFSLFGADDPSEDTNSPYTGNYTINDDDSSGSITVIIYDNVNNSASDTITCTGDDTSPDTTIDNIPDTITDLDIISGSATDNIRLARQYFYIKNTTTNKYYNELGWTDSETWLDADANDSFDSGAENWNYNTSLISWANSHSYEIKAKAQDIVGNNDSSPAADTFTITIASTPTVTTNASTGVEEMNATLWGWLQNNGSADTTCGFRHGTSSGSYDTNITNGIVQNNTEFSNDTTGLTPGQIYYYQAWANNSGGFANGSELTFLTKPNVTANFNAATYNSTQINLSWNKGDGANNTYIERNQTGATVWARGEGILIYNGTGTYYEDTGLTPETTYYYQAWSYANWTYDSTTLHKWSDNNASVSNTTQETNTTLEITPASWDIGTTTIGSYNYSTSDFYFNLTNEGNVVLNIQIKASNATNATTGANWTLTSTPGFDNYSLLYNKSNSWNNINLTYDTFVTGLGVGSWQTFDLNIFMATTSSKSDPLSVTITFRSVIS